MSDHLTPTEYASFLVTCLRDVMKLDVPVNFETLFLDHIRRLGLVDYEDFGSLVLLECEELIAAGRIIDDQEWRRMLDRIRHRAVRRTRREIPLETAQNQSSESPLYPEAIEAAVQDFASQLSDIESVVFELRYIQYFDIKHIIERTGLSQPTLYRTLAKVRNKFMRFVSQR